MRTLSNFPIFKFFLNYLKVETSLWFTFKYSSTYTSTKYFNIPSQCQQFPKDRVYHADSRGAHWEPPISSAVLQSVPPTGAHCSRNLAPCSFQLDDFHPDVLFLFIISVLHCLLGGSESLFLPAYAEVSPQDLL